MSELKLCSYCKSVPQANTWTLHGISETRYFCPNPECPHSVRTVTLEEWDTRPIEDELNKRIAELEEQVWDLNLANEKLESAYFADETIAPDGTLKPSVRKLLKRIEKAETDYDIAESHVTALTARIAELEAENAELRDVIGDYRNDASRVLDEKCPSDERHCGCVPILREQLTKYQKALVLITTMPELSQATTIAREALQERGKFIWKY